MMTYLAKKIKEKGSYNIITYIYIYARLFFIFISLNISESIKIYLKINLRLSQDYWKNSCQLFLFEIRSLNHSFRDLMSK